jgi:hypothetical protein
MADITQRDFQSLLKAQQQTTEMLRQSMLTAEQREAERLAAEERFRIRSEAQQERRRREAEEAANRNAENQEETQEEVEKSGGIFGKFITFIRGNRAENTEKEEKSNILARGTQTLLGKIAGGITTLKDNAINTAKKAGKTGLAILSGIAFGALLYAFGEFLQSDTFKDLTNYLTGPDGLLKRLSSFDISFGEGASLLGVLLGGVALAFSASGLSLLFKPINLAVKGITAGLGSLGTRLGGVVNNLGGRGGAAPAGGGGGAAPAGGGGGAPPAGGGGGAPPAGGRPRGALGKVGSSIASVGKGAGAGIGAMLKGMAGGLAAIANPLTLAGLAAVTVAINGIAFAIEMASPAFEPFGKLLESAGKTIKSIFEGLGSTIESIGNSIGTIITTVGDSIGAVIDKITSMETAGAEATTKQIKELSAVPAENMIGAAIGIEKMKAALDGFGGGTFTQVMGSIFGGGGPIEDILKLAEKSATLSKAATAITAIAGSGMTYKQLMDEEKRQSRMAELEKRLKGNYRFSDRKKEEAELAKLQGQAPAARLSTQSSMQGMFTADPRVEAMITSAINKSKLATTPVVNNVVTNNTDVRDQSQNTQQQVGAPLTNAKYPRLAYGTSRDF